MVVAMNLQSYSFDIVNIRNKIFVQFDSRFFVPTPMKTKTAILARDLSFHVEPHIHVIALANSLPAVFTGDFYFQLYRQFRLNAAFRNAAVICPHDGTLFRQQIGHER